MHQNSLDVIGELIFKREQTYLPRFYIGGSVEERLYKKTSLYRKFEFSFFVFFLIPFKELFFSDFQYFADSN
jgi:hypothetical protein